MRSSPRPLLLPAATAVGRRLGITEHHRDPLAELGRRERLRHQRGAKPSRFPQHAVLTLGWQSRQPARWKIVPGTTEGDIMGCFTPEALPVLSALARGYAVCDQWFAPAPT